MVRIKELDAESGVELKRLEELGSVERCRISEEHRSGRFDRWSRVAELSVEEAAKTKRVGIDAWRRVASETVAATARIEEIRIKHSAWLTRLFGAWWAPTVAGLLFGLSLPSSRRRHGQRSVVRRAWSWASGILLLSVFWRPLMRMALKFESVNQIYCDALHSSLRLWQQAGVQGFLRLRDSAIKAVASLLSEEHMTDAASKLGAAPAKAAAAPVDDVAAAPAKAETKDGIQPGSVPAAPSPEKPSPAETPPAPPTEDDSAQDLRAFLESWDLAQYANVLQLHGYGRRDLMLLNSDERDAMFRVVGCKPGHRVRFRRLLDGDAPFVENR